MVLINLQKAFDAVNHEILVRKMTSFQIIQKCGFNRIFR